LARLIWPGHLARNSTRERHSHHFSGVSFVMLLIDGLLEAIAIANCRTADAAALTVERDRHLPSGPVARQKPRTSSLTSISGAANPVKSKVPNSSPFSP